ncbi:MAG: hypothetical protein JY451_10130 [Erythrobacter sp.]|nr:MAG: hypothetical protein JY451_10130 [Erythrobacter sp.]
MTISREELAAWTDGEIHGERAAEIAAAVEADGNLREQVEAHRTLKQKLTSHFAPLAASPVPDRLMSLLKEGGQIEGHGSASVIDISAAKDRLLERRRFPRWGWVAGPALAASLALAVFLPREDGGAPPGYADSQLASVLDTRLVADQESDAPTRILLSFRTEAGEFCRAFTSNEASGLACRDASGWRLEATGEGDASDGTDYRMAGSAEILALAQERAAGPALDSEEERAAREAGWR